MSNFGHLEDMTTVAIGEGGDVGDHRRDVEVELGRVQAGLHPGLHHSNSYICITVFTRE